MQKAKIAVLDQDRSVRECITLMLHSRAEVRSFGSEEEFMHSGGGAGFDCLLLEMPVARGIHQRLLAEGHTTPVIYLSGDTSVSEAVEAIKRGAVDYLCKPVASEEVERSVDEALRQKRTGVPARYFSPEIELDPLLDAIQRELIGAALSRSRGVVGGRTGAAALLGVTRTGLLYKMKRLGIRRSLEASSDPCELAVAKLESRPAGAA